MSSKFIKHIVCLLLFLQVSIYAQQDSQYTQYMYNTMSINPAYAASRDAFGVFGLYRTQWIGLDGAPTTGLFAVEYPANDKVGLGITFINDKIGISQESTLSADFSYTIKLGEEYNLSFGVKGSMHLLTVEYSKLNLSSPTDVVFQDDILNRFSPNVGTGVYLHSHKFYAGLSVPNILETKHYDHNDVESLAREKIHGYLITGYVFDVNADLLLKPALLTKAVGGAPLQIDLSLNALFRERFTLGMAYRWDAAVSGLAGFQINKNWFIGYAYDAETTKMADYNSGTHEIFLRYEYQLFKKPEKILSPRFF